MVRIPHSRWLRALTVLGLASAALLIQNELSNRQAPYGIAFVLLWLAWGYVMWAVPVMEASPQGIRFGRQLTPWSEVAGIARVPVDGWQNQTPELIFKNGNRRDLPMITREQVDLLDQLRVQS